ncbi:uncharacterized protein LOC132748931 [Ruditapes philippinarum]|uniref:uncharacterized protein LOC132748931 n=1 Tax=Ruditapes philippinarum TaxID=129788 RepID=UPI00295BFE7B|nr:uncharacterized protein LOC132748931 [Ruditapes philippinarum]
MDSQTRRRGSREDSVCDGSVDGGFPRVLMVGSGSSESLTELGPFIVEGRLSALVGAPESVGRLRNGGLLVEVERGQQAEGVLRCAAFFSIECADLAGVAENGIAEELGSQQVSRDGGRVPTSSLVVAFSTPMLPSSIRVGCLGVRVVVCIPNPLRCCKCFRFGHHESGCARRTICRRCSSDHDRNETCGVPVGCAGCGGGRCATSRSCPLWLEEGGILRQKCTRDVSFQDARGLVESQGPEQCRFWAGVGRVFWEG